MNNKISKINTNKLQNKISSEFSKPEYLYLYHRLNSYELKMNKQGIKHVRKKDLFEYTNILKKIRKYENEAIYKVLGIIY